MQSENDQRKGEILVVREGELDGRAYKQLRVSSRKGSQEAFSSGVGRATSFKVV